MQLCSSFNILWHRLSLGLEWKLTFSSPVPSWLSGSIKSFLYSSSLYSCHLFWISSGFVRSIPFLSFTVPIFAWNGPLVSLIFLKRSLVFPILLFSYFFALITEEGFLISLCYSLELCNQIDIYFLSPLPFTSSFLNYGLLRQPFCLSHFLFLRMILITASCTMLLTSIHSSSGTVKSNPLNLFVTSTV